MCHSFKNTPISRDKPCLFALPFTSPFKSSWEVTSQTFFSKMCENIGLSDVLGKLASTQCSSLCFPSQLHSFLSFSSGSTKYLILQLFTIVPCLYEDTIYGHKILRFYRLMNIFKWYSVFTDITQQRSLYL